VLRLHAADQAGLRSADRALTGRVRRRDTEVVGRHLRHRRGLSSGNSDGRLEVLQVGRIQLADLRVLAGERMDRVEVRLELRDRLAIVIHELVPRNTGHVFAGEAGSLLARSEEYTSELQSRENLVCRLLLEKKKKE